jgi:hypothetical protein
MSPAVIVMLAGLNTKSSTNTVCTVLLPVLAARLVIEHGMLQSMVVTLVLAVQAGSAMSVTVMSCAWPSPATSTVTVVVPLPP